MVIELSVYDGVVTMAAHILGWEQGQCCLPR